MSNKIQLFKMESEGNLKTMKQAYYGYFLPREENLCEKMSFEILAPSSNGEVVIKSYRMIDPSQVRILILDLIKMYARFLVQKNELNEFNINFRHQDLSRKALEILKEEAKGDL